MWQGSICQLRAVDGRGYEGIYCKSGKQSVKHCGVPISDSNGNIPLLLKKKRGDGGREGVDEVKQRSKGVQGRT